MPGNIEPNTTATLFSLKYVIAVDVLVSHKSVLTVTLPIIVMRPPPPPSNNNNNGQTVVIQYVPSRFLIIALLLSVFDLYYF